jgi:hypothetical protein
MAELVVTVPRREVDNCVVERIVKVVPRLVALRAAPAENACSGVAETSSMRTNERPIGAPMPVTATARERYRLARREDRLVERPPSYTSMIKPR